MLSFLKGNTSISDARVKVITALDVLDTAIEDAIRKMKDNENRIATEAQTHEANLKAINDEFTSRINAEQKRFTDRTQKLVDDNAVSQSQIDEAVKLSNKLGQVIDELNNDFGPIETIPVIPVLDPVPQTEESNVKAE